MKTEVKKRLNTCLLLWAAFVVIKWIMLLSPSSILSFLSPLMIAVRDEQRDYHLSGWICLGLETAITAVIWLIGRKKISALYIISMVYALIYVPTVIYWIIFLEFEVWRYVLFLPAVLCGVMMLAGLGEYVRQVKLRKQPKLKKIKTEKEESDNGSSDE